jgi:hypothetical protein
MKYVYVAGGTTMDIAMENAITMQTRYALYSLIHGLRQKDFGLHTIENVAYDIRQFSERYIIPVDGIIVTDSGGYSFIRGDIAPAMLAMLIDCYTVYMKSEYKKFDFIFSLDIPFSLKYQWFNNVKSILEANEASLIATRILLDGNPTLQEKFYFVWHFKMAEQFAIWKHLYAKLGLRRFVRHHAIGGMVGLKKATGICFTPFTGMSFYALNTYLDSCFVGQKYRLHFLGIYSRQDRFHIAFLEALFRHYLSGVADITMSYDSINPVHTARMNQRLPLFHLAGEHLEIYSTLLDVPVSLLSKVTSNEEHAQKMLEEIERRRNGVRLHNAGAFSPINVFSNLELDRFFAMVIAKYEFVSELHRSTSPTSWVGRVNRIFDDIDQKHPGVFTHHMRRAITLTFERTWRWHKWFVDDRSLKGGDDLMAQTIREIGFPGRLSC